MVLAWLSGESWKLVAYQTYQKTGDKRLEPYHVIARKMLHKADDAEISKAERQLGKAAISHPDSVDRLAPGVALFHTIRAPTMKSKPSSSNGETRIQPRPNSGKIFPGHSRHDPTGQPILVAPSPQPPMWWCPSLTAI